MITNEDIIDKYNKTAVEYARSTVGKEDKADIEKFCQLVEPGARLIDVGCAAGRDTHLLSLRGYDVVGTDLAEDLLAIATKTYPDIQFVYADMRNLPFEDGLFEAVWASAVLHHVGQEDMVNAIVEFNRILSPGGVLYIKTKAGDGLLKTKEESVSGLEREFILIGAEELDFMLVANGYLQITLEKKESKSRPGLFWLSGFYKKLDNKYE